MEEVDIALARIDAIIAQRGPPKPRTAAFVALHTKQGVEVSGRGYARQPLEGSQPVFAAMGSWGKVEYVAIYDHEGVLLAELPLKIGPRSLRTGDTLQVALEFGRLHLYNREGRCVECGQAGPDAQRRTSPWERI